MEPVELSSANFAIGVQLLEQTGPLGTQRTRTRETAITTTHDQVVDLVTDHIVYRLRAP